MSVEPILVPHKYIKVTEAKVGESINLFNTDCIVVIYIDISDRNSSFPFPALRSERKGCPSRTLLPALSFQFYTSAAEFISESESLENVTYYVFM